MFCLSLLFPIERGGCTERFHHTSHVETCSGTRFNSVEPTGHEQVMANGTRGFWWFFLDVDEVSTRIPFSSSVQIT